MQHTYDLVIFDLDGTLLNTIDDLGTAVNHALEERGLPLHTMEEYAAMVGHGVRNLVKAALPSDIRDDDAKVDSALASFVSYYKSHIDVHTRPYDGMPELLRSLSSAGVKLAVASNKFQSGTETLIRQFFGDIPFVAIFGNMEGVPLKPDAALVHRIVSMAFPDGGGHKVVLVGDSDTDMKTALNAGIPSVAVTWGFRSREELTAAGATVFADTAAQLASALR